MFAFDQDNLEEVYDSYNLYTNFIVSVSTSSLQDVEVNVVAEEQRAFYVDANNNYSVTISPSKPQYVYYKFAENDSDTVLLDIDSTDDICLIVSVQDSRVSHRRNSCALDNRPIFPVPGPRPEHRHKVHRQTRHRQQEGRHDDIRKPPVPPLTYQPRAVFQRHRFPYGFFVVFVAKGDNSECSTEDNSLIPLPRTVAVRPQNQTSVVSFAVRPSISKRDYVIAALVTLAAIAGFAAVVLATTCVFFRYGKLASLLGLNAESGECGGRVRGGGGEGFGRLR